jgi:hypothetical protein
MSRHGQPGTRLLGYLTQSPLAQPVAICPTVESVLRLPCGVPRLSRTRQFESPLKALHKMELAHPDALWVAQARAPACKAFIRFAARLSCDSQHSRCPE